MNTQHRINAGHSSNAFTLMEVLVAIGIFAIGMVAVAAVFPAAIYLQKQTIQDATSQQVARNAMAIMQVTKLTYDNTLHTGNLANYYSHTIGHVQSLLPPATNFGAEVVSGAPAFSLDTLSYPSYVATPSERGYFWYPVILDQNADINNPLWVVYIFIMIKPASGTPDVYSVSVAVSGTDPTRLDFTTVGFNDSDTLIDPTLDWIRAGDVVLDEFGNILQIVQADKNGVNLKSPIVGTPPTKIYYGRGPSPNKPNPTARIVQVPVVVEAP